MNKLNFGCGNRVAMGWTNVDFHSEDARVIRANFISGFPFPDTHFDVVYSSHVLEHFTPERGAFLIKESWRVLKPGGIIRIVVPDIEATCREYIRVLAMGDTDPYKQPLYNWTKVELLDQLVRSSHGGAMGPMINSILRNGDQTMIGYIRSRSDSCVSLPAPRKPTADRIRNITRNKIASRLTYLHLWLVKQLVPKTLRQIVFDDTGIGEKHRWMYDRYGMQILLQASGFRNVRSAAYNESAIAGFNEDYLDVNPDGSPYKNVSLYSEAVKP